MTLVKHLNEYNAPRRCTVCGDDADFYVFIDGETSEFYCSADLPARFREEVKA